MTDWAGMAGGTAMGAANTFLGGLFSDIFAAKAARRNFDYNEASATLADQRTRRLYNDLFSPKAQMQQIKEAGLSPSIYAGELGGISGQAGAQGAGSSGIGYGGMTLDPLSISQMKVNEAQANSLNAEAELKQKQKEIAEIERQFKEIDFQKYSIDANMLMGYVSDKDGNKTSFAELAKSCNSYEEFIKTLKEKGAAVETEQAQQTLRGIYKANRELNTQIAILSEQNVSAEFQQSIVNALKNNDFAGKNAESAIKELESAIATNSLTSSQKDAWNDVIEKIRETSPTTADICIILGMIVDRFAGSMVNKVSIGPTNNTYNNNNTFNKN